jgi:hypothetical protein
MTGETSKTEDGPPERVAATPEAAVELALKASALL